MIQASAGRYEDFLKMDYENFKEQFVENLKEEVKRALAAGVPKATILTYFYPEVTVERMISYRKKQ